eukprot:6460849-Amphidinium_carterae.1
MQKRGLRVGSEALFGVSTQGKVLHALFVVHTMPKPIVATRSFAASCRCSSKRHPHEMPNIGSACYNSGYKK